MRRLRAATPDLPVIAEEEVAAGIVAARADCFWLVDPLDGTKEFAAGRDDFTVKSAWCATGRPVLGAVGVPARGELLAAWSAQVVFDQLNFPYVRRCSRCRHSFGASKTPEVFLLDRDGKLRYKGLIDDNADNAAAAQVFYLQTRSTNSSKTARVEPSITEAIGCSVKWRQ